MVRMNLLLCVNLPMQTPSDIKLSRATCGGTASERTGRCEGHRFRKREARGGGPRSSATSVVLHRLQRTPQPQRAWGTHADGALHDVLANVEDALRSGAASDAPCRAATAAGGCPNAAAQHGTRGVARARRRRSMPFCAA